jgi:hypothetical protein
MALEFGTYLVLSTVHIHCATAALLDRWALLSPMDRPLALASTGYGWFIGTGAVDEAKRSAIPAELLPVLAFARKQGCLHVLLDSDGPHIADLPVFPW